MPKTYDEVKSFYQSQLDLHQKQLDQTKNKIRKTSILRISFFLLTIVGIYLASTQGWLFVVATAFFGFGIFIFFVIKHARLFKLKQWLDALVEVNNSELGLLEGKTQHKNRGEEFVIPDHPFAQDLDIFGKRSLFQLIDRTSTRGGMKRLASILNHPFLDKRELRSRQKAIEELVEKPEWRQNFQATGKLSIEDENEVEEVKTWSQSDDFSFQNWFYKTMLILNPVLGFGIILAISLQLVGFGAFTLFLLLPFLLVGSKLGVINKEHNQLSRKSSLLERYSQLFGLVEEEQFKSEMLSEAHARFSEGGGSAKEAVRKLSKISGSFDYRMNLLVGIVLNVFFLWDIRQYIRLEKWKSENKQNLENWFGTLAEIDELNSFSGFAFNHPDAVFPTISEKDFEFEAKNVKHPFIDRNKSVGNEISISGWKHFQVITGANMAGKSTYLRTVGINLVLSMTGAPVLAGEFTFAPVKLFTSIKTSDSLQDGESYFFAELKRLKHIIDLLENGQQLFIILDEILRGTNSADKQKGSKALVSQLVRLGAAGMIATHDLTLGDLKKSFPGNIENKRFEVEIVDDELVFDYKLKEGISQNLNASFLMEKMGITLEG